MNTTTRKIQVQVEIRDQEITEAGVIKRETVLFAGGIVHLAEPDLPPDAIVQDISARIARQIRHEQSGLGQPEGKPS